MELSDAVSALSSLAQPARLRVFRLLVKAGESGLCAGDLSAALEIPKNTLSFHLKDLVHAGLVGAERNGRSIVYRLREEGIRHLMHFLMEDCCQGRPELCLPDSCEGVSCAVESC